MAKVTTPTFHFILKRRPDKQGLCPIQLVVRFNGRAERSTGVKCSPQQWDSARELIKGTSADVAAQNARLASIKATLQQNIAVAQIKGQRISPTSLADTIAMERQDDITVATAFDDFISEHQSLRVNTLNSYTQAKNRWLRYKPQGVYLADVTGNLVKGWIEAMRRDGVAESSIRQYLSKFRAAIAWAAEYYSLELAPVLKSVDDALRKITRKATKKRGVLTKRQIEYCVEWLLTRKEIEFTRRSSPATRLLVFVCSFYMAGLAPIDMALLRWRDLDFSDPRFIRLRGFRKKTGVRFDVMMPRSVEQLLKKSWNNYYGANTDFRIYRTPSDGTHADFSDKINNCLLFPILCPSSLKSQNGVPIWNTSLSEKEVYRIVRNYLSVDNTRLLRSALSQVNSIIKDPSEIINTDGITFYSARHSYATAFISQSSNIKVLARTMGRSANTIGTYLHELTSDDEMFDETTKVFGE